MFSFGEAAAKTTEIFANLALMHIKIGGNLSWNLNFFENYTFSPTNYFVLFILCSLQLGYQGRRASWQKLGNTGLLAQHN